MLDKLLNSSTQWWLQRSMDATELRNRVIADNIANADTPGYKRREVIFEEKLKNVLQSDITHVKLRTTNGRHIQVKDQIVDARPEIQALNHISYRNDKNNVDIDGETAQLAKNKILYDALAQSMSQEIRLLRMAITGRS